MVFWRYKSQRLSIYKITFFPLKFLTITFLRVYLCYQDIVLYSKSGPVQQFRNLSSLNASFTKSDLELLPLILKSCPKLESLTLVMKYSSDLITLHISSVKGFIYVFLYSIYFLVFCRYWSTNNTCVVGRRKIQRWCFQQCLSVWYHRWSLWNWNVWSRGMKEKPS